MSVKKEANPAQKEFEFTKHIPKLETCGNCGKEIVSVWPHRLGDMLFHIDNAICIRWAKPQ